MKDERSSVTQAVGLGQLLDREPVGAGDSEQVLTARHLVTNHHQLRFGVGGEGNGGGQGTMCRATDDEHQNAKGLDEPHHPTSVPALREGA